MDHPIVLHLPGSVFGAMSAMPTTPSRLANAQGCGTRNAWQTIWLRFPGGTRWQRAADCRH